MHYYLVKGRNGIVIHADYKQALICRRFLRDSYIYRFEVYEAAEKAARYHLIDITPSYVRVPDRIPPCQIITAKKLKEACLGKPTAIPNPKKLIQPVTWLSGPQVKP